MPALREGSLLTLLVDEQQWAYARRSGSQTIVVVLNNARKTVSLQVPLSGLALADGANLRGQLGLANSASVRSGEIVVTLPARSGEVFVVAASAQPGPP
jgi:hypothetical protein